MSMKPCLLISLTILCSLPLLAQRQTEIRIDPGDPSQHAAHFMEKHQYDSAIVCYLSLWRGDSTHVPAYTLNSAAFCYLKIGDTANALKLLQKCLAVDPSKDYLGQRQNASLTMSEIYCNQHQYQLALDYINASQTKYVPLKQMCLGGFGYLHDLSLAYKRALCYYGLDKKDSVFRLLSPLVFSLDQFYMIDSIWSYPIYSFYVKVLKERYGKDTIKAELGRAMAGTCYEHKEIPASDTSQEKKQGIEKNVYISCSTSFFKIPVHFYDQHYIIVKGGSNLIPDFQSAEYYISQVKKSRTYQLIMND